MDSGTTAGVVVGSVVVVALIAAFVFCASRKKSTEEDQKLAKIMSIIHAGRDSIAPDLHARGSAQFEHGQIYHSQRPSSMAHRPSLAQPFHPYVAQGGRSRTKGGPGSDDSASVRNSQSANGNKRLSVSPSARSRASYAPQL